MTETGVVVMAYGTPGSPDDVQTYYTDIRRGRPPTAEQLADLVGRYEAIGGISPLAERTEAQRQAISDALDTRRPGQFTVVLGQKHASPFIEDAVATLADQGVTRAIGLVLAPHYSRASVGEYQHRAATAGTEAGLAMTAIDSWHTEPAYLDFLAASLAQVRAEMGEPHHVLFTAHSLPERALVDDPYPDQLRQSATAVAGRVGLGPWADWAIAWQSAGRTPEPWRGPDVLEVIGNLGRTGRSRGVIVCPQGFVSDHLEVLYDLDIAAAAAADEAGLAFARTRSLNDDPTVMGALADLIVAAVDDREGRPDGVDGVGVVDGDESATGSEMRVVVVGGGVTGLSAAYELVHGTGLADDDIDVVVLEAGDRFGGKIHTSPFAGRPVDEAADAFLARVPDGVDLCRQLGLTEQLVTPATRKAHLYSLGQLRAFPDGLVLGVPTDLDALAASGAVSTEGVARAGQDLTMGPDRGPTGAGRDESVGELVRRRVGDEVFERLVAPLLSGVHAGNADRLSVAAGAPAFAAALRDHDSLMAGLAAQRQAATGPDAPVFYGLASGTEGLIDALVDALRVAGAELALGSGVSQIQPQGGRASDGGAGRASFEIHVSGLGTPIDADAVILTTPLDVTARLLAPIQPDLAEQMAQVDYASVALIALAVPLEGIDRPLDGSGFLVAQPEGLLITACSWASSKWAHLADPTTAVLRASVGRADDTRADSLRDPDLVQAVTADLATTMDVVGTPTATRVTRWPRALPQFAVGHLDRVEAWQAQLAAEQPGLLVAGAGLSGLGIPACIRQGRAAARAVKTDTVTPGTT